MADTAYRVVDFNRARRKRRRGIFIRRVVVLAAIGGLISGAISLNHLLVGRQFSTRVVNFAQSLWGPGFPQTAPPGRIRDVRAFTGGIAVLTDTNLLLLGRGGQELPTSGQIGESTLMLVSGSRIITYTAGGSAFAVYFQNRQIATGETDGPIRAAALGERGNYAIVSSTMQFRSQVIVFTDRHEQHFRWDSPGELVSTIALSPGGGGMAVGSVSVSGGQMFSTVFMFNLGLEEMGESIDLHGELILSLEYTGENQLAVITDTGLRVIDTQTGQVVNSYDMSGGNPVFFRVADGRILLLYEAPEYREQTVVLFGGRGDILGSYTPEVAVRDIQIGSRGVYLLSAHGATSFDHRLNLTGEHIQGGIVRILLAGDTLYYFTDSVVGILSFGEG